MAKAKTAVRAHKVDIHTDPVVVHDHHVFWELLITAVITALILIGGISWWQRTQVSSIDTSTTSVQ